MSRVIIDHATETCPSIQNTSIVCSSEEIVRGSLTVERMQWARQAGHDPALVGLMRVYKDYYPEVIVGDVTMGRASVFTVRNFYIPN